MSVPQPVWVLTCGSLWVNVSSSASGSVDIRLLNCESMSAPPTGVLTPNSVLVNQLLVKRCVTYLRAVCCISGEFNTEFYPNKCCLSTRGVGSCSMHIESGPAPNSSGGTAACCHLHGDNVCCAALKQSIMMALAAYAASPFPIEGMW